jgi:Ca-activated chloride channel family protein
MRPLWLLALLPCVLLLVGLWRHYQPRGNWQRVIDHELLLALSADTFSHASRAPLLLLALAWLLAVLALAGPSWQKLPQPVYQKQDALVILLDLSPSMYATDITPSRLVQAQREIRDILKLRQEGLTALIAYAGDAHVVTPLTDDTDTIELLLPSLAPAMMPRIGNQPVAALQLASELAANNPSQWVRVLFITDEIPAADFDTLEKLATEHEFELSILAIGSDAGAPIPLTRGGFLNNSWVRS